MPKSKHSLSPRFWCALTIFSLMGQIAWVVENMYFNVFIYKMFHATPSDISNMVAASAVAATLTTVLIGALSDRIGKRKLFISLGYILWGVSIFSFVFLRIETIEKLIPMTVSAASVGVTLAIVLDCVMTFFGSSANDAAFNAWLTDSTGEENRGAAEGINAMMPLVAILAVFGGFMFFDLNLPSSWSVIFTVIGVLVTLIGILGLFLIKEPPIRPVKEPYFRTILYGFRPSTAHKNPTLYVSMLAFVLFNISIQIFMPYLILYYEVSLGMTDYVLIMAPAIILASAVTAFWGKVYDKKGFGFSGILALLALAAGYIILFFTRSTLPVFIGSLLMMSGYLAGMAVFGAIIRDHTPKGKSGTLQGVRIFSQVLLPGVIGPFIGKTVLRNAELIVGGDGTTSFVPNANIFLAAFVALLFVFPAFFLVKSTQKPRTVDLITPFEDKLDRTLPFSEYPRPQMKRDSYLCLNGTWDLEIRRGEKSCFTGEILVPFPPESRLSGVRHITKKGDTLLYHRTFTLPEGFRKDTVLLHLGAVDLHAEVAVNGIPAGTHAGGYLPFSCNITSMLKEGENHLSVTVTDPLDPDYPYGKQRHKRGGMWYTPISGIWQTVWMESLPASPIEQLRISTTLDAVILTVRGGSTEKQLAIETPEGIVTKDFTGESVTVTLENPRLWTPETPHLYPFTLRSGEDTVSSYFALRTISVKEVAGHSLLCLNDQPYFFHGLLDQGYFSDGIYLPATAEGYENDILRMKECGFNMLRKHIKIEPDLFYYYCDKHGMAVFQDMVNSGRYSFLIDTALPTVLAKRGITHRASKKRREIFLDTAKGTMEHLWNHPSVLYYTIFNEGWGQFSADEIYRTLKAFDESRIFDSTSGWFKEQESDVESDHIYFKPVKLKARAGHPAVLSEFGGYSCKIAGHAYNLDKTYGYRYFDEPRIFEDALVQLYEEEILSQIRKGLSATVLTQVSDVEDETNGLLTYDRALSKVDATRMRELSRKLYTAFSETFKE